MRRGTNRRFTFTVVHSYKWVVVVVVDAMGAKRLLVIGVLAVLVITAGCSEPNVEKDVSEDPPGERIGENVGQDGGTYKFTDNETRATCYVVQHGSGDPAIDCIRANE